MLRNELTQEMREQRGAIWLSVLNTICSANEFTGNRACDNGAYCDRCGDYEIQLEYAQELQKAGLPLLDDEQAKVDENNKHIAERSEN
jgi:hypothetical protein